MLAIITRKPEQKTTARMEIAEGSWTGGCVEERAMVFRKT